MSIPFANYTLPADDDKDLQILFERFLKQLAPSKRFTVAHNDVELLGQTTKSVQGWKDKKTPVH